MVFHMISYNSLSLHIIKKNYTLRCDCCDCCDLFKDVVGSDSLVLKITNEFVSCFFINNLLREFDKNQATEFIMNF